MSHKHRFERLPNGERSCSAESVLGKDIREAAHILLSLNRPTDVTDAAVHLG